MVKRSVFFLLLLFSFLPLLPAAGQESGQGRQQPFPHGPRSRLQSESEKLSYALGLEIGTTLSDLQKQLDMNALSQGIDDGINSREPQLSPEEIEKVKAAFLEKLQREKAATTAALAARNKKAGDAFLAENKMRQNVVTTPSGLQYTILREGNGKRPTLEDTVKVNYVGMLLDGTVFDSSYQRHEPATFKVDEVIPAWTEALQLMRMGSKYRLFVPPDLAYGGQGAGPLIGPNQTLIFDIELLGIEKGKKEGGGGPGGAPRPAPEIGPGG
ncbi:MAG: FKBP-type peptidyl-prolyl cis-trans isomerase [Desulfobacteraceae bacterium]|nr:FKBP-type peptidyl-prolyl cis-trans isomerase [Desulfobacteraceae bacterium]